MKIFYQYIVFCLLLIFGNGIAQNSSVFSNTSKGLGLSNHFLSAAAMGMGNAGLANSDSSNLNLYNYSQWSLNSYTYFSFNIQGEANHFESNSLKESKSSAGIGAFLLSIPLIKGKFSTFVTFYPAYSMDHKNFMRTEFEDEREIFDHDQYLIHKGHLIQYNGGFAYSFNRYIQVAANFIYFSGSYTDESVLLFDNAVFDDLQYIDDYTIKGNGFGLSSTININPQLSVAAYVEKVNNCKFKVIPDEEGFGNYPSETKNTSLPYNLGVGVAWRPGNKLDVAMDYIYKNWESGVPTFNDDDRSFEDIHQFYGGIEYKPESKWNSPFLKKLTRRIGFFRGNEGYKFNNNSVDFMGLSLGLGIPINNFGAKLDIALSGGMRGDLTKNGAKEQFIKMAFSFKVGERWFVRTKK